MQLECFTMPDNDVKLEWSRVNPFQFNQNLSLPDFEFDRDNVELKRCDKSYETGTYSRVRKRDLAEMVFIPISYPDLQLHRGAISFDSLARILLARLATIN